MFGLAEASDEDLIELIKANIDLQVGYHFKGSFAKLAFEANCILFEEAARRGIVDYSGQRK